MKVNRIETKSYREEYEAVDGTTFSNKEECRKYEESAKCVLLLRLEDCKVTQNTEENLYGIGSCEYYHVVYNPKTEKERDAILQLHQLIIGSHENDNYEKLSEDINKEYLVFGVGDDYDHFSNFYYYGTVDSIISNATKMLKNK